MNKTFLLCLFAIGAGSLVASSFIKQPNQKIKKISIAHLKEQLATAHAKIVDLLLELSHEQTNCLQSSVEEIKRMCNVPGRPIARLVSLLQELHLIRLQPHLQRSQSRLLPRLEQLPSRKS